jgi:hypothetical protein
LLLVQLSHAHLSIVHRLLNRNQLTGQLPIEFAALTSLRLAFFEDNLLQGNMASLCQLPNFQTPDALIERNSGGSGGGGRITADCLPLGGVIEIGCECCTTCCNANIANCNDNYDIPNLDPTWEANYNRVYFTFGDETSFFSSDVIPP